MNDLCPGEHCSDIPKAPKVLGHFVEKHGPRKAGMLSAGFYGLGIIGTGLAVQLQSMPLFYLTYGVMGGIGLGVGIGWLAVGAELGLHPTRSVREAIAMIVVRICFWYMGFLAVWFFLIGWYGKFFLIPYQNTIP